MSWCVFTDVATPPDQYRCANCGHITKPTALPKERLHFRCRAKPKQDRSRPCQHLGQPIGFVECPTCNGNVRLKVFACDIHQQTTMKKPMSGIACCATCREYVPLKDFADSDGSAAG